MSSLQIARVLGISVRINWSWILIFALITYSFHQHFQTNHIQWTGLTHLLAAFITSFLFFFSLFLHEMGHSIVARFYGIEVASITLFIFGGVASIKSEPKKPSAEFWIALAGPLVSIALSILFFLPLRIFRKTLLEFCDVPGRARIGGFC